MKRHNLSQVLGFRHVTALATPASFGEADRTEPIDETALAREMARIMQRTPAQDLAIVANGKPRWLGDDADRAIVDAYLASDTQVSVAPTDKVTTRADSWGPELVYSADITSQWLRHARRARLRNRLRNAAGWTISIAVSLVLVAAVSIAMYGWPNTANPLRQIHVKSVNVSASRPSRAKNDAAAQSEKAQTAPPMVSAELETLPQ
jgi:hypothetical protein